jgi:2-keto-4-pentenoate hydratase/2-oxohepta-3-ene-1,7-dioic acid hydratase in catechol pathway
VKLLRYEQDWQSHWGVLDGDTVYALEGDPYGDARPGPAVGPFASVRLLAPCQPATIWSLGANYPSRCYERGFPLPTRPSVLVCPGSIICGPGADIRIPEFEPRAEFGAEVGIVLRADCRNVAEDAADAYILGYTGLNNVWIKDLDEEVAYARPIRVYDTHCPTGPIVDTAIDPSDLRIRLWVDGALHQDDRTSTVVFPARWFASWLSQQVPLRKGDLLMTGTPGGVEGQLLHFGQTVEIEVEGIGRLANQVTRVDTGAVANPIPLSRYVEQQAAPAGAQPAGIQ